MPRIRVYEFDEGTQPDCVASGDYENVAVRTRAMEAKGRADEAVFIGVKCVYGGELFDDDMIRKISEDIATDDADIYSSKKYNF